MGTKLLMIYLASSWTCSGILDQSKPKPAMADPNPTHFSTDNAMNAHCSPYSRNQASWLSVMVAVVAVYVYCCFYALGLYNR